MGEFRDTIGELLGVHLALFEYEWQCKPDDIERARMVALISEAFRNFSDGGLPGFNEDFDRGYRLGKRDVRRQDLTLEEPNRLDPSP